MGLALGGGFGHPQAEVGGPRSHPMALGGRSATPKGQIKKKKKLSIILLIIYNGTHSNLWIVG